MSLRTQLLGMAAGPEHVLSMTLQRGRLTTKGAGPDGPYVSKLILDTAAAEQEYSVSQGLQKHSFVSAPSSLKIYKDHALFWMIDGNRETFVRSCPRSVLTEQLAQQYQVDLDELIQHSTSSVPCYGFDDDNKIVPCPKFAGHFQMGFAIVNFAHLTIPYHGRDAYMLMDDYTHPMDMEQKLRVAVKMIYCVKEFHSTMTAHRDIKLENFLVDSEEVVRLCDLEFCLPGKPGERVSLSVTGTQNYIAPELCGLQLFHFDPFKSDLWSLGITIASLLLKRFPFNCASEQCPLFMKWQEHGNNLIIDRAQLSEPHKGRMKDVLDCLLNVNPDERKMPDTSLLQCFSE